MKDEILNDPQCAPYTDISHGWVNEAFLEGAEYGERITLNRVLGWVERNIGEDKVIDFKDAMDFEPYDISKSNHN